MAKVFYYKRNIIYLGIIIHSIIILILNFKNFVVSEYLFEIIFVVVIVSIFFLQSTIKYIKLTPEYIKLYRLFSHKIIHFSDIERYQNFSEDFYFYTANDQEFKINLHHLKKTDQAIFIEEFRNQFKKSINDA